MAIEEQLRTCVVIGGRNFVGRSLVFRLLSLGHWIVRVADSAQSLELDLSEQDSLLSQALSTDRASYFTVDIRKKDQLIKAVEGASAVFHVDDVDSCRDDFFLSYTIIVQGAKNVINACRECKVKRLIYNSTADVVFSGYLDIHNGEEESLPYASKFENVWSDFKAQAEALVLFANDINGLLTCALRPSNIFGPGDNKLVPSIIDVARSEWEKFIIGSGESMSDFTYVENVAHALVCAEEALGSQMVSVSGKAFFITNFEPMKFWDFVSLILEGLGYERPMINIPSWMIKYVLLLVKWMHSHMNSRKLFDSLGMQDVVHLALCNRTFNCSAAQKHLGYSPVVSVEEGVALTVESFAHLSQASCMIYRDFDEPSKVDKLLGGGTVSEILLWRDEKKSFNCFLVLALLYYWFFLCGRTFVSSAASLLLLISVVLFGYGILPSNIYGFTIPRISSFEISEVDMKKSLTALAHVWKSMVSTISTLAQGEDWHTFLKVAVPLYLIKSYVLHSLTISIGIAFVLAFTSLFVYEQYEVEIDGLVVILLNITRAAFGMLLRYLPMSVASLFSSDDLLHEGKEPGKRDDQKR